MTAIAEAQAGRELDALVAEKVMGWKRHGLGWSTPSGLRTLEPTSFGSFQPSTDIAAAWEVVEKLKADWRFLFQETPARKWRAAFTHHRYEAPHGMADGDTAPLAICRAALKAVGA